MLKEIGTFLVTITDHTQMIFIYALKCYLSTTTMYFRVFVFCFFLIANVICVLYIFAVPFDVL